MLLVSDCVILRTTTEVATMLGLCTTMVHLSCKWNGKLCVCLKKKETKKKSVCVWVCVLLWYICLASGMVSCVYVWKRKRQKRKVYVCGSVYYYGTSVLQVEWSVVCMFEKEREKEKKVCVCVCWGDIGGGGGGNKNTLCREVLKQ